MVKSRSKVEKVEEIDSTHFTIWVRDIPHKGRANKKALALLAEYLNITPSKLSISSGNTNRYKVVVHE